MGDKKIRAILEIGGSVGSSVGKSFALVTGNTKKLGASIKDLEKQSKHLKIAMKDGLGGPEAERALAKLENRIASTKRNIDRLNTIKGSKLGSKMSGFAGALGGGLAAITAEATAAGLAIWKLANHTAEYADSAGEQAEKLGMSVNGLIKYKYAADQVGTGAENLEKGLAKMQATMEKARKNGGGNVFKLLHLDAMKLSRQKPEEQLMAIADAFKNYHGRISKTAIAMALFGKSGKELVPMLNLGREGIERYGKKAEEFGLTLDDITVQQGSDFKDLMKDFNSAFEGLSLTVGRELLPVVTDFANQMIGFVKDNKGDIAQWARDFGQSLRDNLPDAIKFIRELGGSIGSLATSAKEIFEPLGGAKAALVALVGVQLLPAIAAFASLAVSIGKVTKALLGMEIAGWGAYAPIAAIAGSAALIGMDMDSMRWKKRNRELEGIAAGPDKEAAAKARAELIQRYQDWQKKPVTLTSKWFENAYLLDKIGFGPSNEIKKLQQQQQGEMPSAPAGKLPDYLMRGKPGLDNRTIHNNITINATPGMDERSLADLVLARLTGRQAALAGGALYD